MNRLLSSNFIRLWKSRTFWIGSVVLGAVAVGICLENYYFLGRETILDGFFFGYALLTAMPLSVFCGLFLGVEYGDGTIRNKLIAGHSRAAVYLSNLITVFAASLLMAVFWLAVSCLVGIPLFGGPRSEREIVLLMFLESILVLAAFSALFTAVGMLWQNKALSAVLCILLMLGLYYGAMRVDSGLSEPEFWDYALELSDEGEVESVEEPMTNPYYLRGTKRALYEFLYDFLPSCQGYQIANMFGGPPRHTGQKILYSLVITVSVTGSGMFLFSRKDIK